MDDYRKIGIGLTAAGMLFFFLGINPLDYPT